MSKKIFFKDSRTTLESMSQAYWYNQWTLNQFKEYLHGDILEIGCGIGNFTSYLTDHGNVWAIDIDQQYLIQSRQIIGRKAQLGIGDIEKGEYFFGDLKFDSIVCLNVLEHIKNDKLALSNMFKLLKTGGKLILLVPAHEFLYGGIDKSIGHFRRYNKLGISKMLEEAGFRVGKLRSVNFLGALGWFLAGKILKKTLVGERSIELFNLVAPIFLQMENIIEFPFGTSILAIAERKL